MFTLPCVDVMPKETSLSCLRDKPFSKVSAQITFAFARIGKSVLGRFMVSDQAANVKRSHDCTGEDTFEKIMS